MASLIGWVLVGVLSLGTVVGVVGILVSSFVLALRKAGELTGRRQPAAEVATEAARERATVPAA